MKKIAVRAATEADYPAVANVLSKTMPGFLGTTASLRETDQRPLISGPRSRFIAEIEGCTAGIAHYQPNLGKASLGISVLVLEEYRKLGVGKALYEVAHDSALSHHPESIWTKVSELSPESIDFASCS